jgi:hypothetical protein
MDHEYSKLHPRPKSSRVLPAPVMAAIPVQREPKTADLSRSLSGFVLEASVEFSAL